MSPIVPHPWITFDLIERLVRKSKGDNRCILRTFNIDDGIGKAENFCSNIVRVSATFRSDSSYEQTQNFIVKSSLEDVEFDSLNKEVAYFPKEIIVYDKILPAVGKLLFSIGEIKSIAPR